MKKRIVSFLMALVMAVSLLPVSALAADTIYTNDSDTSVKAETQSSGVYKDADDTVVTNMKVRYGKSYLPDFFEKGKKEYTLAVPEGWTGFLTYLRFLYKGIIIKHNKTEPTYTKTSLFLCEKRRFFMARTEKGVVTTI